MFAETFSRNGAGGRTHDVLAMGMLLSSPNRSEARALGIGVVVCTLLWVAKNRYMHKFKRHDCGSKINGRGNCRIRRDEVCVLFLRMRSMEELGEKSRIRHRSLPVPGHSRLSPSVVLLFAVQETVHMH